MPADSDRTEVDLLLERAVHRHLMDDPVSPGYSGALLERLELDDGSRVVLKRSLPDTDLAMRITNDPVTPTCSGRRASTNDCQHPSTARSSRPTSRTANGGW